MRLKHYIIGLAILFLPGIWLVALLSWTGKKIISKKHGSNLA